MAVTDAFHAARRAGLLDPRQSAAMGVAFLRWGPTLATVYAAAALRHPRRAAVVDHQVSLTFQQLDSRSTAAAHGLRSLGLRQGQHLGVLCHNHADFMEISVAASKAGLRVVYLNTGFASPQLAEVVQREGVAAIVCDADLAEVVAGSRFSGPIIVADGEHDIGLSMEELRNRAGCRLDLLVPRPTSPVLLTSGTTGTPKGAQRGLANLDPAGALGIFERIPYRGGDVFVIPCPLFHAWGLSQMMVAASLGSTVVLVRHFEPAATLQAVSNHEATVLAVVPIMLQRLLASDLMGDYDLSSLRIVASSGSALPARVATEWMDRVGENLYNMYGSTEAGQATIATPSELRAAPGTAGRVVAGTTVLILDERGNEAPAGTEGRIFVGNRGQFSGYTDGGNRERVRGLMSTGDIGYFDSEDRLSITGRSDDMIISGGENVYPGEVEDVLLAHPAIIDAAVVGVADDEFGQRLSAFVVTRPETLLEDDAVREFVHERLARHKVPRDVTFTDQLPRTPTGKLLRRHLVS